MLLTVSVLIIGVLAVRLLTIGVLIVGAATTASDFFTERGACTAALTSGLPRHTSVSQASAASTPASRCQRVTHASYPPETKPPADTNASALMVAVLRPPAHPLRVSR